MGIRRKKTLLQQAADYVEAAVDTAREKAGPVLADARDKAGPILADARDKAGPALADARDRAVPLLNDARDKAGPVLSDARSKAAPLIAQSAAIASERASAAADFAADKASAGRDLATDKANELRGKPKKKHRLRKLLVITGVAALLGFVAKKMQSGSDKDNWQSSYTPTPAPRPSATDTPIFDAAQSASDEEPVAADEGGAGPDEALADAVEEQHEVTTPDEPADVVELDGDDSAEKPTT
jgi:vacuolar-type H+-ATPase subunit H